jgi:phenylacetate-coenzyme A ligase PaaK-like adenylate-forming protein
MARGIEQIRAAHFGYFCNLMPKLVERLAWSRAQIDEHQTTSFRHLLVHARRHSRWNATRLNHIDPARATLADLSRIPPMTKADLMDNWNEIVTIPGATLEEAETRLRSMKDQFYLWDSHVLFSSGGTGGRPGLFIYDWDGLALNWAGMSRSIRQYVASLPTPETSSPQRLRMVVVGAEMSAHGSFVVSRVLSDPRNPMIRLSGWRSADDLIPQLNEAQPEFLVCYPNLIPSLAEAAKCGRLTINPKVMLSGGEHYPRDSQQLAREAWPQTDVLVCWGTSEGGGTFPCPCGDGFHVSEDQVIIEPVDAAGSPIGTGQRSAGIYFTNLYNKAQPIIRYHIDDVFEMADGPCICGSAFRKVRQVHGRNFEKFKYGAATVHPVTLQLAVLEQPNILEYQFRQTPHGVHLVYSSKGSVDDARLERKMFEALRSYGLFEPDVVVKNVPRLELTSAGKLKRFVPLIASNQFAESIIGQTSETISKNRSRMLHDVGKA